MSMTTNALRARYLADSITTAPPAKLLVMLYDRLILDLTRAEQALAAGDRAEASRQVVHAQEILLELRSSLDTTAWSGAEALASLYGFLLTELVAANVAEDAARLATCRQLIEPIRDAWRESAVAEASTGSAVA